MKKNKLEVPKIKSGADKETRILFSNR